MTRATTVTALAAVLITLAVVGGFLALDRTVLHVYYNDDAVVVVPTPPTPVGLTATEAEIYAVRYLRNRFAEVDSSVAGNLDTSCNADEQISAGWLVQCDVTDRGSGRTASQAFAFVVNDRGEVSVFP